MMDWLGFCPHVVSLQLFRCRRVAGDLSNMGNLGRGVLVELNILMTMLLLVNNCISAMDLGDGFRGWTWGWTSGMDFTD